MYYTNQRLLGILPAGSEIIKCYTNPIDRKMMLVDYDYLGERLTGEVKRIDVNSLITYESGKQFYLSDGLTVNDLYETLSTAFNLDLIKNEDYLDNTTPVTKRGVISLPIEETSLRYLPNDILVEVIEPRQVLISDEKTRNLTGLTVNPFNESLEKELFKVGTILFNGVAFTCFNKNLLTLDFRNFIIAKLNNASAFSDALAHEILTAKVINCVNDGLSDIVFLSGSKDIVFLIRFVSKPDDLPVLL